jgi:hypothetical protein
MRNANYINCRFCNKHINPRQFVDLLVKNKCCKDCYNKGRELFPNSFGNAIIHLLEERVEYGRGVYKIRRGEYGRNRSFVRGAKQVNG